MVRTNNFENQKKKKNLCIAFGGIMGMWAIITLWANTLEFKAVI